MNYARFMPSKTPIGRNSLYGQDKQCSGSKDRADIKGESRTESATRSGRGMQCYDYFFFFAAPPFCAPPFFCTLRFGAAALAPDGAAKAASEVAV
jgi:hypothetical protein